jgi:hypothetical protein
MWESDKSQLPIRGRIGTWGRSPERNEVEGYLLRAVLPIFFEVLITRPAGVAIFIRLPLQTSS